MGHERPPKHPKEFWPHGAFCRYSLQLNENWAIDSPSYKFTKLDVDNSEHKKMIDEYLLWEGDFGGKTFNQGKIFK